jgi:hypothetical protein
MKKLAVLFCLLAACDSHEGDTETPSLTFTVSGEDTSRSGFLFPASGDAVAFTDGWEVKFEKLLVTVDRITLSDNPDKSPTDQSQVDGVVAEATGPWAVDLVKTGAPATVQTQSIELRHGGDETPATGRGSVEDRSIRLVKLSGQNRRAGKAFDTSLRYAVGYEIVKASPGAVRVNVDAADADYAEMIQKGWSVLYVGTATHRGTSCTSSDPSYDWSKIPRVVKLRFGFAAPVQHVNCQNTDLTGQAFAGEEKQRGVQLRPTGPSFAQLTLHVDHPFWHTVDHEAAEPYFDQMAALAKNGLVTLDDLAAADFTSFKDASGADLPWRSCIAERPAQSGTRKFDPGSVAVDPAGQPERALRNYRDLVVYMASTMGHLNDDGLCAVKRQYPSPP